MSIELFQHVIIMMSSNIKRTRAQSLVYNCCLVFSEEALERLSPYAEQVASDAKERYKEKISIISGLDPFLGPLGACTETVPSVEASDLVSYLVLQTRSRFLTAKQFKAHKSMEAYDQFVCGYRMGEGSQNMEKGRKISNYWTCKFQLNACSLADLIPFNTGSSFTAI